MIHVNGGLVSNCLPDELFSSVLLGDVGESRHEVKYHDVSVLKEWQVVGEVGDLLSLN